MRPIRHLTVGDVRISVLLDTTIPNKVDEAVPPDAVEALRRDYPGLIGDDGRIWVPVTCYLVRTPRHTVLVDTGVGPRPRWDWSTGSLDQRLRNEGVRPEDVDIVVNTHFHDDHVGWNTIDSSDGSPQPFFPRATFVWQQAEWDHWVESERIDMPHHEYIRDCVQALADGNIRFVDGECPVTPELMFVPTPGHTPGHVAIGIRSGGQQALVVGDATHFVAQLDHPDWSPAWDENGEMAARTRTHLFDQLAGDGSLIMAGHWPFPGCGRIIRLAERRVFEAV